MTEAKDEAPASEHVLGDDGQFHVTDAPIELSHYVIEDWVALGFFWLLGLCVFYQFFTRYALNDSAAWTEEIARYLLICTVFVGIASATRRTRHIHVDFLYRLIPARLGRAMSTVIDLLRIAFFAVAVGLTIQMMTRMAHLQMTIIDLPMNIDLRRLRGRLRRRRGALGPGRDRELEARLVLLERPEMRSRRPS